MVGILFYLYLFLKSKVPIINYYRTYYYLVMLRFLRLCLTFFLFFSIIIIIIGNLALKINFFSLHFYLKIDRSRILNEPLYQ